ncbi:MAG: tetratricopeptide repeat protein [Bryobacteraceae bacterium]|nr:tetratricopeptide repeat protein [Bryobacteraceae bacterium]
MTGRLCLALALAAPLFGGELLVFDAAGALLGSWPAEAASAGFVLAPRQSLYGAARATYLDGRGGLHPVLWVSGDDPDAGIAELFVGYQAAEIAPRAPEIGRTAVSGGRRARVRYVKESGGFGWIARLEFDGSPAEGPGPLFDEQGRLLGWMTVKTVDGAPMHFGIPIARLDQMHATLRLDLPAWNAQQDRRGEEEYQRALGHLWADDFDGARFYFARAVELRPTHARAWMHLGFVEGKTGRTRRGMECYETAIRHDPKLAPAYYYLGFALVMAGDGERAKQVCAQLEKLDPALGQKLRTFIEISHVDVVEKDASGAGGLKHRH